jgi:hypothetical protein
MKSFVYTSISIIILSVFLTNCAGTSKTPESKSAEAKNFDVPSDRGSVYLYRTGRMVGAAGQLMVKVNNMDAGGTGPGTFFKWDLKPGTYTFASSTGESSAIIQIEVKAGEMYFIRQDARLGLDTGRVTMKEVSDSKGKKEIASLKLLVSSYVPN